jgi:hypothetical protein
MGKRLRLRALTVTTETAEKSYQFAKDLTVITGSVSTGKSTLLMLIKYAFGGGAVLTPAVEEHVLHVTLEVELGQNLCRLRRNVAGDRTKIHLLELGSDTPERSLPIRAPAGELTASRFMLGELDIPVHRVPRSRARPSSDFVSIGFSDVFGYCYLQAKTIDSSATGHHDASRDAKRMTMFEILFDIVNPEVFQLRLRRNNLVEEISVKRKANDAIRQFLEMNGYADLDVLRAERWQTQESLRSSEKHLATLKTDVDVLIERDRRHRTELSAVLEAAARAREALAVARDTVRAREAALAQRRLDLGHSDKAAVAAGLLSPFEFVSCPRCLQSLSGRHTEAGHCLLCLQPEPPISPRADDEQRSLLRAQVAEIETLLEQEQRAVRQAEGVVGVSEVNAAAAQRRFDELTREAAIDEHMSTWQKLGVSEREVNDLNGQLRVITREIKQLTRNAVDRERRLAEISAVFAEEVRLMGVNVNAEPSISPDKYLPKIGNSDLESLQASGGGSTTAINVAFSLALMTYSIPHADVLLPSLLIIDSPRKGIGSTEEADQQLARKVYERIRNVAQALTGIGQLIIADNDAELGDETDVWRIRLTESDSAVPGVPNTGVGTQLKVEEVEESDDD